MNNQQRRCLTPMFLTFIMMVITAAFYNQILLADAPEEKVWNDAPTKGEPDKIGPRTEQVQLDKYKNFIYVSTSKGSDKNNGLSRSAPFKTITRAIADATHRRRHNRYAILVAAGTYSEPEISTKIYADLYGGFNPENWERDIFENKTIIDARGKHRVINTDDDSRIDGFVITGGAVKGHGGAILCNRTSPTITNNIITGNKTLVPDGFVHDPDRRRHVANDGAGIACVDGANPVIAHNIIYGNGTEIGNGGGIIARDDACPKIIYNVIWGNINGTKDNKETRSSNGGAIALYAGPIPVISNNLIANNAAKGKSDAGAIYCEYNTRPDVTFNFILGNTAADDGAAMEIMKSSEPTIRFNYFAGNVTGGGGGAIRLSDQGLARISDNIITRNTSDKGGGIACTNAWMICERNIIVANDAERAGGIVYYNENWIHLKPPVIQNNIIWANTDKQIEAVGAEHLVTDNIIQGGYSKGKGNTGKDPELKDDSISGTTLATDYNAKRFQTVLTIKDADFSPDTLAARVIRIGKTWTIIKANTTKKITVWGNIQGQSLDFEILPTYKHQF